MMAYASIGSAGFRVLGLFPQPTMFTVYCRQEGGTMALSHGGLSHEQPSPELAFLWKVGPSDLTSPGRGSRDSNARESKKSARKCTRDHKS